MSQKFLTSVQFCSTRLTPTVASMPFDIRGHFYKKYFMKAHNKLSSRVRPAAHERF